MPNETLASDSTIHLRPEEQLISVENMAITTSTKPPTSLAALQLLADVKSPADIGKQGPLVASRALPENADQPQLRLYEALFGRDSLMTSYFLLDAFPQLAKATLVKLAELQGVTTNDASEEEPGKIIHEAREPHDPIAQNLTKTRGWQWPYYGSVDATPLFIRVVSEYARRHDNNFLEETYTDREGHTQPVSHAVRQAVAWLKKKMASNPEGLVESLRLNTKGGHINQVWKDSPDSYHHADGSLANSTQGVASIEVQAYAYDALCAASELLGEDFTDAAKRLRATIFQTFWIEHARGGYFALGSDRDEEGSLRVLKVRTSNMGHLLNSRLLDENDATTQRIKNMLVETLIAPDLLTRHGLRTLGSKEKRYYPTSYHNGSVWPWDTYFISLGLQRQGFAAEAGELHQKIRGIMKATKCFPEFVSGEDTEQPFLPTRRVRVYNRQDKLEHTLEQPPQEIQAWTVAAAVAMDYQVQT